jgi:hypothetical protein
VIDTQILHDVRRWHRPLVLFAAVMAVVTVVALAGLVLDDRVLLGVPIWLKPLKFGISFVLYALTIAWMLTLTERAPRLRWWLGTGIVAMGTMEMIAIVGQTVRGHPSHFNVSNEFDNTVWRTMGASIVLLWVLTAIIAVLLLRERGMNRVDRAAVRLGLAVALIGMALAFLMVPPTEAQLAIEAHGDAAAQGAHSVGVPDGGPGMPLTGWSTTGGDLRIGHFIGMHALQALPLLALLLGLLARRRPRRFDERTRYGLIWVGALAWAGVMGLVTWQALRGQSLIHPDATTMLAALGLLAAVLLAGAVVLVRPRPVLPMTPQPPGAVA